MIKHLLILFMTILSESKGSFPCPVRKNKIGCEKAGCEWIVGYTRPIWYPPWLWVSQDKCWWATY